MKLSTLTSSRSPVSDLSNQQNHVHTTNQPNFNIIGGVFPHTPSKLKLNLLQKQHNQNQNNSPSPVQKQLHNFRPRSNTVRNETGNVISLKKVKTSHDKQNNPANSKTLSTKKFASNSSLKSSLLSSPKPSQFKTLVQENKKLKDNIVMLTKLIQEVVPVFSSMAQQNSDKEQKVIKSPKNNKLSKGQSTTTNQSSLIQMDQIFGSISNKSRMMTQDQLNFLQQSLQQLQNVYEQKQTDEGGCFTDVDSDFMDAEGDLDLCSIDERTVNNKTYQQQDQQKQQFQTFGGKFAEPEFQQTKSFQQDQSQPLLTGQRLNSNSTQKTKISDLNKQSKNFNMPVCLDSVRSKKKIIDYEGVKQLQGMIDNINKSEILQELKLIQPYTSFNRNLQDQLPTRNQILQSNYSSANLSGDSFISDDDLGSIPADSLLSKNFVFEHQTINKQNLLQDLNSQPFNSFSLVNLQQKYNNNLGSLKCQQKPQGKVELMYPKIIPLTSNNFNSCTSVESYEDNQNLQTLDNRNYQNTQESNNFHSSNTQEQIISFQENQDIHKQVLMEVTEQEQYYEMSHNQIEIFDQQNQSSQLSQINIQIANQAIIEQKEQVNIQKDYIEQNQNDIQVDEWQQEIQDNKDEIINNAKDLKVQEVSNDNIQQQKDDAEQVQDFLLQSQSKDCFMFTQSIVMTDQNIQHSKRASIDPLLQQLMRNESPLKDKQLNDSIQHSERRDFGNALGFEDSQKLVNISDTIQQQLSSRKESNLQLTRKISLQSSSKKNKENFSDHEHLTQRCVDKVKTPIFQGIQVYQSQQQLQQYSTKKSQVQREPFSIRQSISNKESGISSYNNSPKSSTQQLFPSQDDNSQMRGKSISHHLQHNNEYYRTSQVNLQVIKSARPSFGQLQNRWSSIEEKEQNLVKINQEAIMRSQDHKQEEPQCQNNILNLASNVNMFDISPSSNIRQTPQLDQHIGNIIEESNDNLNFSSFNMTLSNPIINDKQIFKRQSASNQNKQSSITQEVKELVIENFALQPIIQKVSPFTRNYSNKDSLTMKNSNNSCTKINKVNNQLNAVSLQNQDLSFNQTFNAFDKVLEELRNNDIQNTQQDCEVYKLSSKKVITNEYKTQRTLRDKFIYEYKTHQQEQLISELDRLNTPSPRNLFDVLISAPTAQLSPPLAILSQVDQLSELRQNDSSFNKLDQIYDSQIQEGIKNYELESKEEFTQESVTYKSSQLDKLMNDYLRDYGYRNKDSLSNGSRSQNRSVSPHQQIRSQYSSGEFIEVSAPNLSDSSSKKMQPQLQNNIQNKASSVYEYQSSKVIPQEQNNHNEIKVDLPQSSKQYIQIEFVKEQDSQRSSIQSSAQYQLKQENNCTIKEEPSFEEQESSNVTKYEKHNQSMLQSQKLQLVQQQLSESQLSNTDSKISLTNIDMAESEIFSNYVSQKSLKLSEQNYLTTQSTQVAINNGPTNSQPNSRKTTPLRKYISIGSQSSQKSSPILQDNYRRSKHLPIDITKSVQLQTLKPQSELQTSILQPVLKQARDKSSQNRSPLKNCKPRDSISIDYSRTIEQESQTTAKLQIAKQKREQIYKVKMDELQQKLDIKLQKITCLPLRSSIQEDHSQAERETSNNRNQQSLSSTRSIQNKLSHNQTPQTIFGQAVKQRTVNNSQMQTIPIYDAKYQSNSAIQRKTQRDSSRQKELENKLQEKEQRIQCILQKKKEIDDKIQEQRQARESFKQSQDIGASNLEQLQQLEQPKHLSLTRGSLVLVRTPNKVLQQKMILKKDMTSVKLKQPNNQNFYNAKQSTILQQITQNQSLRTIQVVSQPMQLNKNLEIESLQQQFDNNVFIGPITERTCTIQHKDTALSPMLMRIQPTLKQKEFFQKIESDCHSRKQQKQFSRIQQVTNSKIKVQQQQQENQQSAVLSL